MMRTGHALTREARLQRVREIRAKYRDAPATATQAIAMMDEIMALHEGRTMSETRPKYGNEEDVRPQDRYYTRPELELLAKIARDLERWRGQGGLSNSRSDEAHALIGRIADMLDECGNLMMAGSSGMARTRPLSLEERVAVRHALEACGKTIGDLAKEADLPVEKVSAYLNDEKMPTPRTAWRIIDAARRIAGGRIGVDRVGD